MDKAKVNGIELEYAVQGAGEPVLLIGTGPIADSFLPFFSDKTLANHHHLIRYHQRGQVGSTHWAGPVNFATYAADAAALLDHLGIGRAHVAGHSTGAIIAVQLAADWPDLVHTLTLMEPPLAGVPSARAFFEKVAPAFAAYGSGDSAGAMAAFLSTVSSLDWDSCRTVIDTHVPGGVAQAMQDADTVFGGYLPALNGWEFGPQQAATISQPVLSVVGTDTDQLFAESHALLHTWFPQVEDRVIEGVAHLSHLQRPEPVVQCVAEFFARNRIAGWQLNEAASAATGH